MIERTCQVLMICYCYSAEEGAATRCRFALDAYFNHTDSTSRHHRHSIALYRTNQFQWRADHSDVTMDWTGGTRRRFTGAKNSNTALKKQKAYFAKARAASHQEPAASHLNPLSSSQYKLPNPMGALDSQRHSRSRRDAKDRRVDPRVTSSRGMGNYL